MLMMFLISCGLCNTTHSLRELPQFADTGEDVRTFSGTFSQSDVSLALFRELSAP
jgi:hypothetical protein